MERATKLLGIIAKYRIKVTMSETFPLTFKTWLEITTVTGWVSTGSFASQNHQVNKHYIQLGMIQNYYLVNVPTTTFHKKLGQIGSALFYVADGVVVY